MKIALGRNDSIWKEDKSGKKLSTEKLIIDLQAEIEFLKCAKLLDPELQEFEDSILERRFLYHKKSKENKFILSSGSIFFSTTEGQQIVFKILKNYIIYEINGRESEIKAKRLLKTEIARLRSLFWQVPTTSIEHTMKDFQLLSNARLIEADRALFACETRKRTISIKLLDQDHPHCAMLMPDGANSSCADSKIAHLINIIQTDMGRFRETKKHKQNYDETWPEEQLMNWLIESEFIYRNKHNSKHFFLFKKTTLSLQNICKKFKISYINLANYNEFLAFK